jgi:ribosome-associated toxin RatA of RatAB toxin-antitoxin module
LLGRVVAPVFENIATSMVDSFARRAEALYE